MRIFENDIASSVNISRNQEFLDRVSVIRGNEPKTATIHVPKPIPTLKVDFIDESDIITYLQDEYHDRMTLRFLIKNLDFFTHESGDTKLREFLQKEFHNLKPHIQHLLANAGYDYY